MDILGKPEVVFITDENNQFVIDLIKRFKRIPSINFYNVIYLKKEQSPKKIKECSIKFYKNILIKLINPFIKNIFSYPRLPEDLLSVCSKQQINLHTISKGNKLAKALSLLRSFNCDILLMSETGTLKQILVSIFLTVAIIKPCIGEFENAYATPGFYELWNDKSEVVVRILLHEKGNDKSEIISQQVVPIFQYDTLRSVQKKLAEVLLSLYSNAIEQLSIGGNYKTNGQIDYIERERVIPKTNQRIQLFYKIKKRQFNTLIFIKTIAKWIIFPLLLLYINIRDFIILKLGGNILSVLYYHRVTDICQDGMTVSIDEFEKQIRFLKKWYHIVSPFELDTWLNNNIFKGKKGVLITFDDGYEDNYINALPILEKYSCPAIFFISTGLIGNDAQFKHDSELQPRLLFKKMDWDQVKEAKHLNIAIGIHSHNHANLGRITFEEAIQEIRASINVFQEQLGDKPIFMSYPFGGKKDITVALVNFIKTQTQINFLFSAYGNKNFTPIEKYNIKRINIGSKNRGLIFLFKTEGGIRTVLNPYF